MCLRTTGYQVSGMPLQRSVVNEPQFRYILIEQQAYNEMWRRSLGGIVYFRAEIAS